MTITLAIATATSQVGVALAGDDGPIASMKVRRGRRHTELLAPAIETVSRLAGVPLADVTRLAVDTGPGLFTGLRVGLATAKAMASALGVPLVGCTSLDVLAHPHRLTGQTVVSVVDARRGEVFWAVYRPAGDGRDGMIAVTDPAVSTPASLADALASAASATATDALLVTGDGARRYAGELADVAGLRIAGPEHDHPSPAVLAELAATRPALIPEKVSATYLRGADVRIGWAARPGEDAAGG